MEALNQEAKLLSKVTLSKSKGNSSGSTLAEESEMFGLVCLGVRGACAIDLLEDPGGSEWCGAWPFEVQWRDLKLKGWGRRGRVRPRGKKLG